MIEFLQDYTTEAVPPEHFAKGQQVERSEGSEGYFVGRGLAGYVVDGKLVDAHYRPIVVTSTVIEVVQPGNRRADLAVRAGEVMTGQPPRGTSGPGSIIIAPVARETGRPSVVLEAEIERLQAELETTGAGLANVQAIQDELTQLRAEHEKVVADHARLTTALSGVKQDRDQVRADLDSATAKVSAAEQARDEAVKEADSLREQLAQAKHPASGKGGGKA